MLCALYYTLVIKLKYSLHICGFMRTCNMWAHAQQPEPDTSFTICLIELEVRHYTLFDCLLVVWGMGVGNSSGSGMCFCCGQLGTGQIGTGQISACRYNTQHSTFMSVQLTCYDDQPDNSQHTNSSNIIIDLVIA